MEVVAIIFAFIWKDNLIFTFDLKDAYYKIPIHPESRAYLYFMPNDIVFQLKAVCFDLLTVSQIFHWCLHYSFCLGLCKRNTASGVI